MTPLEPQTKLVVGNWKMNGAAASADLFERIVLGAAGRDDVAVAVCPPATLIAAFSERARETGVAVGAQTCHAAASGAHTGEISAEMLRAVGATLSIVGHSERRSGQGETDADIRAKAEAALRAGLSAILCVGETAAERDRGAAVERVSAQVDAGTPEGATAGALAVAYEPIWAIGSGRTPNAAEIAEIHAAVRARLVARYGAAGERMRILYGGSVNAANAAAILAIDGVDGALVGGASLDAEAFLAIIAAAAR